MLITSDEEVALQKVNLFRRHVIVLTLRFEPSFGVRSEATVPNIVGCN